MAGWLPWRRIQWARSEARPECVPDSDGLNTSIAWCGIRVLWGLGLDPGDAREALEILREQTLSAEGSERHEQHLPQGAPGLSPHSRSPPALEADVVPDVPASAVLIRVRLPAAPHLLRAPSGACRFHLLPASTGLPKASVLSPNCPEAAKQLGRDR